MTVPKIGHVAYRRILPCCSQRVYEFARGPSGLLDISDETNFPKNLQYRNLHGTPGIENIQG